MLEEYINQNNWREWYRYLDKLPLNPNQVVCDLGCSIGHVTRLMAPRVKKVIGIDHDAVLLTQAQIKKPDNCEFLMENIFTFDPQGMKKCDGIWMSFALAYIEDPERFLSAWTDCLNPGGWFAIVDIDGLFSSHLPDNSDFFSKIEAFEAAREQSRGYDFRIGEK